MDEYHFVKLHHKMQETCKNCFGLKISSTSCCYILGLMLTCFCLTKGLVAFFQPETIVASFLHLMVLFSKKLINLKLLYIENVLKRL